MGVVPGLVGVAVNVTDVPEQTGPEGLAAIETVTGFAGVQVIPAIFAHQVPHLSFPPPGVAAYCCTVQKLNPVGSVIVAV